MAGIQNNQVRTYNRSLYAYVMMLKQIGAKYSDQTLDTAAKDIEGIYQGLSQTEEINSDTIGVVHKGLDTLRLNTLNLQITICNKKYRDILPVCEALALFINSVEADIEGIE